MRVSIVDYDLNNFHADKFLSLFRGDLAHHGVEVVRAYGMIEDRSKAWAEKNGVAWAPSPEAAADAGEAVMLLAPDNAEVHLFLAERVFHAGKPVFVDKTFANDLESADALAALAERHGTPVFSSSALRFAPALRAFMATEEASEVLDAEGRGPGKWSNYGVHAVEPVVALMGPDIRRIRAGGRDKLIRVEIEWNDGRTGLVTVNGHGTPFRLIATTPRGVHDLDLEDPRFYNGLAEAMAGFFKSGKSPVPLDETLAVMEVLHRMEESLQAGGWVRFRGSH